jgi:hypothetical protein
MEDVVVIIRVLGSDLHEGSSPGSRRHPPAAYLQTGLMAAAGSEDIIESKSTDI